MNVLEAYQYMRSHDLLDLLDVHYVLVNPETLSIDFDQSKNTKLQVWLEFGRSEMAEMAGENSPRALVNTHYWQLDCGGDTFEEALIKGATRAKRFFEEGWNPWDDFEPGG